MHYLNNLNGHSRKENLFNLKKSTDLIDAAATSVELWSRLPTTKDGVVPRRQTIIDGAEWRGRPSPPRAKNSTTPTVRGV